MGTRTGGLRRKLPARWMAIVMPLVLSGMMTFVVSAIATLNALGFVDGFAAKWMAAWGLSWVIAFPVLLVVLPVVRRLVNLIVEQPGMPPGA